MRFRAALSASLALRLAVGALLVAGGPALAAGDSGILRIAGSDSMAPFLEQIGERLSAVHPGLRIAVDDRGSSTGPPALLRGEAAIAAMTRPMNDAETAAFGARAQAPAMAFAIALDAVAIYVNATNPLTQLTLEQLDAVFSRSRRCHQASAPIDRWGALGLDGEWADRKIGLYTAPAASGTQALFRQVALCGGRLGEAREQPGTRSVAMAIAESRYAIGVGTLAGASAELRALALPARDGSGFATTDEADLRSGRYPLERELFLYVKRDSEGRIDEAATTFLRFALSPPGQQIIERAGFLPLSPTQASAQQARLP